MSDDRREKISLLLDRARESLAEARILADSDHWRTTVNRLYYACFYAVSALLHSHGLESKKHSGVRSLLNKEFVKTGILTENDGDLYNLLFDMRQDADYDVAVRVDPDEVRPWMFRAEELVQKI